MGYASYLESIRDRLAAQVEELLRRLETRPADEHQIGQQASAILDVAQNLLREVNHLLEYLTDPTVDLPSTIQDLNVRIAELENENGFLLRKAEDLQARFKKSELEIKKLREFRKGR